MSDIDALKVFARQRVSQEMVDFLAATTESIIQVKQKKPQFRPLEGTSSEFFPVEKKITPLKIFIKNLIKYSNVQTPTLMASLIYLNRLRNLLPANAVGMETTKHRIFLASLILAAKTLNDSSPLNKHWTRYTDGLLTNQEVNMAERELIALLKWDISIREDELVVALQPFLTSIRSTLAKRIEDDSVKKTSYYKLSSHSNRSLLSVSATSRSSSSSSISSVNSTSHLHGSDSAYSLRYQEKSTSSLHSLCSDHEPREPLMAKSSTYLNIARPDRQTTKSFNVRADLSAENNINTRHSGRILA